MEPITESRLRELEGMKAKADKQVSGEFTAGAVHTRGHAEMNPPHWHILDMRGRVVMDTLNSELLCIDHDDELGNMDVGTGDLMKFVAEAHNEFDALAAEARKGLQAEKYRNLVIELLDATPDDGCWASVDGSDFDKIDNILAKLAALTTQANTDGGTGG